LLNEFNIRILYRPLQPTVKQTEQTVSYREILPDGRIENFIYCYWELKTNKILENEFVYRVVADGCIDIFFRLDDPGENFVMGFCRKYTEFLLSDYFHYIGIRFFPGIFPAIFKIDAKELSNRFERLELVVKETSAFINNSFSLRDSLEDIKIKLDDYFINNLIKSEITIDPRFQNALKIIFDNSGVLNVQTDLDTGLSPRQLRRYFDFYIGDTPKTFSKVVRFQNILKAKPSTQSLRQNKLFYDTGYFDQAHFIKEFKNFYGVTPGKVFGR